MRTGWMMGVVLGVSGPVIAQPLADSLAEFSGIQGEHNWLYGYYTASEDKDGVYQPSSDFVAFDEAAFNGTIWRQSGSGAPATTLTAVGGIPNGATHPAGEQWAIRRWVATDGGAVVIDGLFGELDARGGGTTGRIFIDGVQVFARTESGAPRSYQVEAHLMPGSVVDFAIDPNGDAQFDLARFTAVITPVPCSTDLDRNGVIDVFDLLAYLDAWFGGDADLDGNGLTEPLDLALFVTAWFGGQQAC